MLRHVMIFQVRHALLEFAGNVKRRNGRTESAGITVRFSQANQSEGSNDDSLEWGLDERLDLPVAVAIRLP